MTPRPDPRAWLTASPDRLRPALEGCATGALPPNVALLRLAMEAVGPEEVESALASACDGAGREPRNRAAADRLRRALLLWRENPQAFTTVKAVLDGVEHHGGAADAEAGLAHWAKTFDRMAHASPEGSVALYALGNPDLLREATAEVVARLHEWRLVGPGRRVLEIGCGIGRFVEALAPHADHVTGLDIAPAMIARARQRCAGLTNVSLAVSSGRDLAQVPGGSVDLVLAADVFPYLVQTGSEIVDRHVREAVRVLKPGGHLLVLNFSYRGDLKRDRSDIAVLAARCGLSFRRSASEDFSLWDAATFLLQKP
jgi:ubiquinone/menaquinone biosynthesis C-methylase UbiE